MIAFFRRFGVHSFAIQVYSQQVSIQNSCPLRAAGVPVIT